MKKKVLLLLMTLSLCSTYLVGCNSKPAQEEKQPVVEDKEAVDEQPAKDVSFDWSNKEYVKNVPLPDTDKTVIEYDTDYGFWVHINGDEAAFLSYVEKCKEAGFNINPQVIEGTAYSAYNQEGTNVSITLSGTQYELVVLESKINNTFVWPSVGMATCLPKPDSDIGTIELDSSTQFVVYVGGMEAEEFKAYVESCINMGFNQNYTNGDTYFDGENQNGDKLRLRYEGVNTMFISIEANDGTAE